MDGEAGFEAAEERERLLEAVLPPAKQRAILEVLIDAAVGGNVRVAEYLIDRLYGRPGTVTRPVVSEERAQPLDLRGLSDEEVDSLVGLLERCGYAAGAGERGAGA